MERSAARHAVLTGAPGAGKTTLLEAAARAGFATSREVARTLLQAPGGMELRETDPLAFAEAMLDAHLREYELMDGRLGPVIFDRGLPDVVGFLDVSGLPVAAAIDAACRNIRYLGPVFRAPRRGVTSTGRIPSASRIGPAPSPAMRPSPQPGVVMGMR